MISFIITESDSQAPYLIYSTVRVNYSTVCFVDDFTLLTLNLSKLAIQHLWRGKPIEVVF